LIAPDAACVSFSYSLACGNAAAGSLATNAGHRVIGIVAFPIFIMAPI